MSTERPSHRNTCNRRSGRHTQYVRVSRMISQICRHNRDCCKATNLSIDCISYGGWGGDFYYIVDYITISRTTTELGLPENRTIWFLNLYLIPTTYRRGPIQKGSSCIHITYSTYLSVMAANSSTPLSVSQPLVSMLSGRSPKTMVAKLIG